MKIDAALIVAFQKEYAAQHNDQRAASWAILWEFAAEIILNAFLENADDECWDWQHAFVDKYAAEILAEHPQLAKDEDSILYQEEE